jgi:alanyl-tRNA synthetase
MLKAAIDNNWSVSLPPWGDHIKDVADAVKEYGRLYVLTTILHYKVTGEIKINLLKKKLEALENKELALMAKDLLAQVVTVNGTNFLGLSVPISSADALRKLGAQLKPLLSNCLVVLTSIVDDKAQVLVLVDDALVNSKNLDASKIIKEQIAPLIKGGGGGQKTMATAGGQDVSQLEQVIEKIKGLL